MRFHVRKAVIPQKERDVFDKLGVTIVQTALFTGWINFADLPDVQDVVRNSETRRHASAWLTEQSDRTEKRETRLEILEWTIVALIVVEVAFDLCTRR